MTRPLRIDVADGLYHVTSRGWERRTIVRDDGDRQRWLDLLARVAVRRAWRVFAWALMDNHFHLYLRTPEANLSAGMHDLNAGYASGFNRRHQRCGVLFQGRFKAVLVEDESHSRELTRYVHLNPVRAKLVERPEDYLWGSCPDYWGRRRPPEWLDCETILGEFAADQRQARRAFRRFLKAGMSEPEESPLAAAVGGMFLGTIAWVDAWRRRLAKEPPSKDVPSRKRLAWRPTPDDIVTAVSAAFDVEPADILIRRRRGNDARMAAMYLVRSLTNTPVGEIGRYFDGVSAAAVSKTVKRVENLKNKNRTWTRRLNELAGSLITSEKA
jgi:putative transposase